MKARMASRLLVVLALSCGLLACGGGGGGSTSTAPVTQPVTPPVTNTLSISDPGVLQAIYNRPASWTLTAQGGTPPYTWSTRYSLPAGLTFDAAKATISGTPIGIGNNSVIAHVSDSSSPQQTAEATIHFDVELPLTIIGSGMQWSQYIDVYTSVWFTGGFPPYTIVPLGGTLPAGMKFFQNGSSAYFYGIPLTTGNYSFSVSVSDSFKPPQSITRQYAINVDVPQLWVQQSLPARIALNRPFSGRVIATGGVPPYTFSVDSSGFGSFPPGLNPIDAATGQISGTPSAAGTYHFFVQANDSQSPSKSATGYFTLEVAAPLGRNDSPATATPIANGTFFPSISPYIDPTDGTPVPGDNDYYAIDVMAGATMIVSASRNDTYGPLDPVVEIVDANGLRLNTCGKLGLAGETFTSPCIDDDPEYLQQAALAYRAPSDPAGAHKVYAHVLDWRGDARPDMTYMLTVSGAFVPITFQTLTPPAGIVGSSYYTNLGASGGTGYFTVTVVSGQLPPGIFLLSGHAILSGTPTTAGTYTFTLQVADSATPQQVVTQSFTIVVAEKLLLGAISVPTLTVGQNYTQQVAASGGTPPYQWSLSNWWVPNPAVCTGSIDANGLLSLSPTAAGSCTLMLAVQDSGTPAQTASTPVAITVNP